MSSLTNSAHFPACDFARRIFPKSTPIHSSLAWLLYTNLCWHQDCSHTNHHCYESRIPDPHLLLCCQNEIPIPTFNNVRWEQDKEISHGYTSALCKNTWFKMHLFMLQFAEIIAWLNTPEEQLYYTAMQFSNSCLYGSPTMLGISVWPEWLGKVPERSLNAKSQFWCALHSLCSMWESYRLGNMLTEMTSRYFVWLFLPPPLPHPQPPPGFYLKI